MFALYHELESKDLAISILSLYMPNRPLSRALFLLSLPAFMVLLLRLNALRLKINIYKDSQAAWESQYNHNVMAPKVPVGVLGAIGRFCNGDKRGL